jgi:hypothetical protein
MKIAKGVALVLSLFWMAWVSLEIYRIEALLIETCALAAGSSWGCPNLDFDEIDKLRPKPKGSGP